VSARGLPRGVVPVPPGPGQESVWDYPRPPRCEPSPRHVVVVLGGEVVADSRRTLRVLETSHPPGYYIPADDWHPGALVPCDGTSVCEWKGAARYFDVHGGGVVARGAAWDYPRPTPPFAAIAGCASVYPGRMDRCELDGVAVTAQDGGFYGGWITDVVVGPFKGGAGTWGW
jgi:uncharacterized protein (DUF427 family)